MPLTNREIETAKYSKAKDRLGDGNGLYLRIQPAGAKSFQLRVDQEGQRKWVTLGAYPEISLKKARDVVGVVRTKLDAGVSLIEIRAWLESGSDSVRSGASVLSEQNHVVHRTPSPSFREVAKIWFDGKIQGLSNGKHIQQNWNTVETYVFPVLGDMSFADIKREHVKAAIKPIWQSKHETAERTLARVIAIFEVAIDLNYCENNVAVFNTDVGLGGFHVTEGHFGSIDYDQIQDFWIWLTAVDCEEHTRQMTVLMVLTAKRTRECRFAEWSFFDDKREIWETPGPLMKMKKGHRVPISRQVRSVLQNMKLLTGCDRHVFAKKTKSGVISENAVLNLVKRYDSSATGHGLRSTFRTWAGEQEKYQVKAMEFALAHQQKKLDAAYFRADLLEARRAMMQDWADFVTSGLDPVSIFQNLN